jgi:hypothetical protein
MKAQEVRGLIAQEDYKAALRGAKDFRIGVTKEQRSVMSRAYECMVHPSFYRDIGKDIEGCIQAGIEVLKEAINA